MNFVSSNIAFTNRIEQGALFFYNGMLTRDVNVCKPAVQFLEREIFSRAAGLLISPAALLEIAFHAAILPFSLVYALGKSVYLRECDFTLPQQHLQRVRDAVFPILFGSFFGLIHPYLGTYAAEPAKKHIATGLLLSNTELDLSVVCSPLTGMSEISSLINNVAPDNSFSREQKLLNQLYYWEEELEKIQSIDFFNLELANKLGTKLQDQIDATTLPLPLKELVKRIALIAYPILLLLDIAVFTFSTIICLGALVVKCLGGQAPAYLEKAWTPEVIIYQLVKIPLFLIAATIGFVVSFVNPKKGFTCTQTSLNWLAKSAFSLKMLGLKYRLGKMQPQEMILLPAVQTYTSFDRSSQEFSLLPAFGSHTRFLLIEKVDDEHYQAELIERGSRHGKTDLYTKEDMEDLMTKTIALRYQFGNEQTDVLSSFSKQKDIIDLGTQTINNCGITGVFAVIEVLQSKWGDAKIKEQYSTIKQSAMERYSVYAYDFFPFGSTNLIIKGMEDLATKRI